MNRSKESSGSFSSKIDSEELRAIKISIIRYDVLSAPNPQHMQPNVASSYELTVYHKEGEGSKPIFDRPDVLVNQIEEERVISSSQRINVELHRSRSKSRSPSQSPVRNRSGKSSGSKHRNTDERYSHKTRDSRSRTRSPRRRRSPRYADDTGHRDERIPENRSRKPGEYIPSNRDSRSPARQSLSPRRKRSRSPRDRKRSRSPTYSSRGRSPYSNRSTSRRRYSRTPERGYSSSSRYSPSRRHNSSQYNLLAPQYTTDGVFIPNTLLAAGAIPGIFPRPMMGMQPRPLPPMGLYPPIYRPRPHIVYNQPRQREIRPNANIQSNATVVSPPGVTNATENNYEERQFRNEGDA